MAEAHRTMGTFSLGTVRASFGYFNIPKDVESLVRAIQQITWRQD